MHITIDIPDDQYQMLISTAEKSRLTLSRLVQQLIDQDLCSPKGTTIVAKRDGPPPVIVPPRGVPIPATSREELRRRKDDDESYRASLIRGNEQGDQKD